MSPATAKPITAFVMGSVRVRSWPAISKTSSGKMPTALKSQRCLFLCLRPAFLTLAATGYPSAAHVQVTLHKLQIAEIDREISQLFTTLRQPLAVQVVNTFADAIVGTHVSHHGATSTWQGFADNALRISGNLSFSLGIQLAANIKAKFLTRRGQRVTVWNTIGTLCCVI